jgi:phosphatidate cytidylyltransferase
LERSATVDSAGSKKDTDIVGLRVRSAVLVAVAAAALLGADFLFKTDVGCHLAALFFVTVGLAEFYTLCRANGAEPLKWVGIVSGMSLVIVQIACIKTSTPLKQPLAGAGVAVALTILIGHMASSRKSNFLTDVAATILGLLYVWFLGVFFFVGIRHLPDGFAGLVIMLFAAKGGDSTAYAVGRKYGKTKLIPRISPKKSYEGGIAGVGASVAIAVLINWLLSLWDYHFVSASWAALLGIAIGVTSIGGDLVESSFKRSAGMKDSSRIFAWYGGVLDVGDSVILCSPVVYFLLVYHGS